MAKDTLQNKYNIINSFIFLAFFIFWNWIYFFIPLFNKEEDFIYLIPFLGIFSYPLWIFIHEAIHGILFSNKFFNDLIGRIMSIYFGAPFRILQSGHLLHHGFNRTSQEILDYYNPNKVYPILAKIHYYFWIIGGLYITEFFSNFIWLLSKRILLKIRVYYKNHSQFKYKLLSLILLHYREIIFDALINSILYTTIFFLYGGKFYLFLLLLIIRGLIISLFDNVFHYGSPPKKIISGYNLKIIKPIQYFILNANFHGLHHRKPKIPWYLLEKEFYTMNLSYDGYLFKYIWKQFRGPIADTNI